MKSEKLEQLKDAVAEFLLDHDCPRAYIVLQDDGTEVEVACIAESEDGVEKNA